MRTIKAIFFNEENANLFGVKFQWCNKTIKWEDLDRIEQIRLLNAWAKYYELFSQFIKDE